MKESCKIEEIRWGNTDNQWKPIYTYHFNTYQEGIDFLTKQKEYRYSYMHKYNLTHTIENYG
jgi:hypothetical protein